MATIQNSSFKTKVGVVADTIGLQLEKGAMVYSEAAAALLVSDGATWVPATGGGGSYLFQNGLTDTTGTVELGGTLTKNTVILGNAAGFSLDIRQLSELELEVRPNFGAQPRSRINLTSSLFLIQREGPTSQVQISAGDANLTLMIYAPALRGFFFNLSTFQIYDQVGLKGVEYNADYSANWTDNSLVTKKWVEDNFVAIP